MASSENGIYTHIRTHAFPVGSVGKNLPTVQEQVQSLGGEDPLEEKTTTHASIFAWEIPWTEEPGGLVYGIAKN